MTDSLPTGLLLHTKPLQKYATKFMQNKLFCPYIQKFTFFITAYSKRGWGGVGETLSIFLEFPLWVGDENHIGQGHHLKHLS